MPANLLTDFNELAPKRDFYESFIAPLVLGQEMNTRRLSDEQTRLANERSRQELPFVGDTRKAELAKLILGNRLDQYKVQQEPQRFGTEQALQQAQAEIERRRAGNDLLLSPNDTAALLISEGYGQNPYGLAQQMLGQSQQSQRPQANSGQVGLPPLSAPGNSNAMQGSSPQSSGNPFDFARQKAGLEIPEMSSIDALKVARGLNPQGAATIARTNEQVAANNIEYSKALEDATQLKVTNTQAQKILDALVKNYKESNTKGPFGSKFAKFSPSAQAVQTLANQLVPLASELSTKGNITDARLDLVASGKPDIGQYPEVLDESYRLMSSAFDRTNQRAPFVAQAETLGIPKRHMELLWSQFQEDFPLTADLAQDKRTNKVLKEYLTPERLDAILTGTYVPISQRQNIEEFTDAEIDALPLARRERLLKEMTRE